MILISKPQFDFIQSPVKRNYYLGHDSIVNKRVLILAIYHQLIFNKNQKIILIEESNETLKVLFEEIKRSVCLISEKLIKRYFAAPYYELGLVNGSRLRGFAHSRKCYSIRGQDADTVYVNEVQTVDPNSLCGAIYPVLHSYENSQLFATMTNDGSEHYTNIIESIEKYDNSMLIDDSGYKVDLGYLSDDYTGGHK